MSILGLGIVCGESRSRCVSYYSLKSFKSQPRLSNKELGVSKLHIRQPGLQFLGNTVNSGKRKPITMSLVPL